MHSTPFRKPSLHLLVLILVMTVGVVMRFWNAFEIPLTYDEYSSLYRAQVAHFQVVLDQGILTDAHPAFINSFLFVWLKVAHTPFLIKLPFLLLSCAALWLTYINGRNWLGPRAGLMGAALLSVGEFPLMYSQIARPYSVGLFSAVFSLWALHRFLHHSQWRSAVVLGVVLAFGAYVHHFLALVGLVFTGYAAYAKWRSLRSLIPVLVAGIVLYIPQLLITLHQLGHKGIGTVISTPDAPWLAHHLSYIGNHDLLWKVCLLFLLGITISKWKRINLKHLVVLLSTWLVPLVVGWLYSVAVAPVLQDRVLIFGLPALFVVLGVGMDYLKPHLAYAAILIITCLGIYSTAANRDYYALFYSDPFSGVVAAAGTTGAEERVHMLAIHPPILERLDPTLTSDLNFINPDSSWTWSDYRQVVEDAQGRDFDFGWTPQYFVPPLEFQALLRDTYTGMSVQTSYNHGIFRRWTQKEEEVIAVLPAQFSMPGEGWSINELAGSVVKFHSGQEWGLVFEQPLNDVAPCRNSVMYCSLTVRALEDDAMLVIQLDHGDHNLYYHARSFREFLGEADSGRVHIALPLYDIAHLPNGAQFKTFVWNNGNGSFEIHDAEVWVDEGYENMYLLDHVNTCK